MPTARIEVLGVIRAVETIATGPSVHARRLLARVHGHGNWRKRKEVAAVRLPDGQVVQAEVHWFEAHGIGRVDLKVKRILSRRQ